jgi:tetratricopeptide (TPR) repeat protein
VTDADRLQFLDRPKGAIAGLPPACQEGFARLAKLVQARRGKFQLLVLDCRDETLRDRLIAQLNELLEANGSHPASLQLRTADHPDFATVERALIALAGTSSAIHVTGGPSWFDRAKWGGFNIRRDAVAQQVKASLLFWLDPDSIAVLARIAIDLWAWRSAVIPFATAPGALPHAVPKPDFRIIDDRTLAERKKRIAFLRDVTRDSDLPAEIRFGLVAELGDLLAGIGQMTEAESAYRDAADAAPDERSRTDARGRIADMLQARGELDEALRIRREEQLPIYERLGDVRAAAVTKGKIADVLQARGELDEALRIRREEALPVYERLGDVREAAITKGKIADVLQARGELDEALRIRREEALPIYERLGDVREAAMTKGQIADVLQARGELDEALRIWREEQLPVYERLGDVRSAAVARGKIADVLQARGELDEALRIRREEELPIYERLGDVREAAVTKGKIADVLQARGELDEALRIRREEALPVYERLGGVRELLVERANQATLHLIRNREGDRQEANRLLRLALAEARRLRLPEEQQIQQILERAGLG